MSDDVFAPPGSDISGERVGYRVSEGDVATGVIEKLESTRPWVLLLSVLGFIGVGFLILAALIVMVAGGTMGGTMADGTGGMIAGLGLGFLYLALGILYIAPPLYLFRYARKIKALRNEGIPGLEDALNQQRKFWKYTGMMTAICMIFYIILAVGLFVVQIAS